jgi:hypothetical protein
MGETLLAYAGCVIIIRSVCAWRAGRSELRAGSSSNSSPHMTDSCYTDELMMRSTEGTYEEAS